MKLNKVKLGTLIELINDTNFDLKYGKKDVMGMTITKEIIKTKAKIENADLKKYIIIKSGEFVFNPRTHGKKIGLGFNNTNKTIIISWNNIGFRIKKDKINEILPDYLFMNFNRNEWDREACFHSWGSSTEVFSWSSLCDMEIILPDISVQRKYVEIYKSLLSNQISCENLLSDLKNVCNLYIENLKKEVPSRKIGQYILQSDEKNNGLLTENSVRGISIEKKFIYTKANMDGVNVNSYKVVKPQCFSYVPTTSRNGEKITIALNETEETYIVSTSYIVFYVKENVDLIPEYLMLFFIREEFDRYARFNSWGSARETFTWTDLCEVEIPIPDLEKQRSIANIYIAFQKQKEINEKLKEQIKNICPILIKGSLEEN